MSDHQDSNNDPYADDSKTDVIAAIALVAIAVIAIIFWVSNQ